MAVVGSHASGSRLLPALLYLPLILGLVTEATAQTTGTVEFSRNTFTMPEAPGSGSSPAWQRNVFQFSKTGTGDAYLAFQVSDDTAVIGTDYRIEASSNENTGDVSTANEPIDRISRGFWSYPNAVDAANKSFTITLTSIIVGDLSFGSRTTATIVIVDDDPTVVSLAKVGTATTINEGQKVEFTVTLGRALIAGEIIDVPLSISGTGVTTGDWTLARKSGATNTGVTLRDTGTSTPKVRFSGAGAQTATLELTATTDGTSEGSETINVALGPDGTGTNGFDHTSLGTNVGGGADPHGANNDFDITITSQDTTAPRVTSIERQSPSSEATDADSLTWRVTFDEAVQNVDRGDFQVDGTTATLAVTQVGVTNTYDVTASGGDLAGLTATVMLSFTSGQNIQDTSGNTLTNTTPTGTDHNTFVVNNVNNYSLSPLEIYEGERLTFTILGFDSNYNLAARINTSTSTASSSDYNLYTVGGQSSTTYAVIPQGSTRQFDIEATTDSDGSEGDETIVVEFGQDGGGHFTGGVVRETFTVTLKDGARPDMSTDGVTISPTSLALTELGSSSAVEKTYTVVLNTDPTADVTITVANGDATAVAVDTDSGTSGNQSALTFTAGGDGSGSGAGNGNWAVPQTVTVRALNDVDSANENFNITHAATAASGPYNNIAVDRVAVTITDAGHGVVVSKSSVSVAENDETETYTVVLKSQPGGPVTISATSGVPTTAEVSPASLTFTNSTWNTPQTVTVTGKDMGSTSISHEVTTATTAYPTTMPISGVTVTVTADPRQVLDLSTASSPANEGTAATLRITATGATSNQTVAGGTALLTFSGEGIASSDYSVVAQNSFSLTGGPPPAATATVNLAADSADEPNETLVVGWQNLPSGYRAGTTATVTIIDQNPTTVTLAGGGTVAEDGSNSVNVTVTLSRNLVAGETVTVPLAITGAGIAGSDYTIVRAPGSSLNSGVTLNTSSPHSASEPAVVFTGHGTNTVQVATLQVTAVPDTTDEGASEVLTVGFGSGNRAVISNLDRPSGTGTGGTTTAGTATVTITDDDIPVITISGGSAVTEGTGVSFTVNANPAPAANLDVTVAVTQSGDFVASSNRGVKTVTINANATSKTYTVPTVNDMVDEANGSVTVTVNNVQGYTVGSTAAATVTVNDDDTAAVTIIESGGATSVTEASGAGRTDTYTVALATQPTHDVTVTASAGAGVQVAAPGGTAGGTATLTFTTSNWNAPQTVTVTGVDDNMDQTGNRSVTISHSATSTDANYNGNTISIANVTATVVDNDGAGVTINESDGVSVTEASGAGNTDTYTVVLDTQPTPNVTITPTSSNTAAATVSPALTFTTSNWNTPQTVTVTGVDDNTDNPGGGREVSISHGASSTDPSYTTSSAGSVEATVTDDDATTVTLSGAGSNMEERESQTFTITLGRGLVQGETLTAPLTFGGTATRGTDYTMISTSATGVQYNNLNSGAATVVFTGPQSGATATRATITLSATADSTTESTAETVDINFGTITNTGLTDAGGVTPTDSLGVFTISDATTSDTTAPLVTSIVRRSPSSHQTAANTLTWRVTFNEAVRNVDRADFSLTGTTATLAVAKVGATNAYDVTASGGNLANLDATVTLSFANNQNIQDTAGNPLATTTPTGDNDNSFVVDNSGDGGGDGPLAPVVQFSTTSYTGGEAQGRRTVNLELSAQPPFSTATTVNYQVGGSATPGEDFTALSRTVSMSGSTATIPVSILNDETEEEDETIVLTLTATDGYTVGTQGSTTITITDDDGMSPPSLPVVSIAGGETINEGEDATFTLTAMPAPAQGNPVTVNLMLSARGEVISSGETGKRSVTIDHSGRVTITVSSEDDAVQEEDGIVTATVQDGTGYTIHPTNSSASVTVRDDEMAQLSTEAAPDAAEGMEAWRLRFGRTLSHQVADALQDRFAAPTTTGLNLTVAGEAISSPPALAENQGLLSKALGFENVTPQLLVEDSSFSFAPQGEAGAPQFALWGQGALSSFSGQEDDVSLDGDVTTLLVGADWSTGRWQAGAALSHSWANGSYDGEDDADGETSADGEISTSLTGLFPYGRYALSPRLGLWATAGYGWGQLSLKPDGNEEEYEPDTTMTMVALGMDGLLLDGGSEGISLNTTADLLSLKTTSEEVEGLESSEGNVSRFRLGLEATRPFPFANGSSLLPSMEVGIRQDGGDAETGFGMDLGAGITWKDPQRGISGELKGRALLSHAEEEFQDQGLALSFSWDPSPSNRGPSLSMGHAMGLSTEEGIHALLSPTVLDGLDASPSNGQQQFEAELAYGFPLHNDRLTLTPAVAMALSPTTRTYGLLWSVTPYSEQSHALPWELSIEAERQEHASPSTPTDHSLKLRFSTLL